jgi:hypothetical protein
MTGLLLEPSLQLDNTPLSLALHAVVATTRCHCHNSLLHRCCNCHHQSTMEPLIWAAAMEMPTLAATRSGHRDISDETLSAATSGGDGERQLAGGRDIVVVSLGVTQWTQASAGSWSSSWNRPPSTEPSLWNRPPSTSPPCRTPASTLSSRRVIRW